MKISTAVLTLSLGANAALLAVLALGSADSAPSTGNSGAATATNGANASSAAGGDKPATSTAADPSKTWALLHTDDLAVLVQRLRAAGFPNIVVQRVIGTLVGERFDARRYEIEKANLEAPFWSSPTNSYNDPKIGPELRKLQREQTELMKQLLGGSLAELFAGTEEDRATLRYQIGDIPPDKLEQLYAAAMNYSEKLSGVYSAANAGGNRTVMLDSDREKMNAIDHAYRDDLAKFLTPAEAADFLMHNGQISGQIRYQLQPMHLTEEEYRAVFPLYQAFQDQNPKLNFTYLPPDASPEARAAVEQLNNQIAATLGSSRSADFLQTSNPEYNQINRLVSRLDLPLSAAAEVVAVQKDVQLRASTLRMDPAVEGPARATQLTALAQEASAKISTALGGARGLEAYKDNGGQWLVNLAPRPRPAAPAPKG